MELLKYQFSDSEYFESCIDWEDKDYKYIRFDINYNSASGEFYRPKPILDIGNRLENNQVLLTPELFIH